MSEFKWPCDRHYAHGPHEEPDAGANMGNAPYAKWPAKKCPGVKAHPATMIGRQFSLESLDSPE